MKTDQEIKDHPWTLDEIEKEVKDVYLIVDEGIIAVVIATVVSNRIKSQASPVWLLLMSGSSAGKSIMTNLISKCGDWIIPVDTLTTNTFASSMKRDTEVSLLHKAKNGVLVFKDFTIIANMNEEGFREIMGQLRGIFDGSFNKYSGNDADVAWTGKIGCLAAGTIEVQRRMRDFSKNGERFLNYIINVADYKEMAKRAMRNQATIKEKEEYLQKIVAAFVNQIITTMLIKDIFISNEIEDEMINVANFCTLARSPVVMSKKDPRLVEFVGDREAPSRMAMMLKNLAVSLLLIQSKETLDDKNARILYKIGLDSIPVERRLCLKVLSEYRNSNTQSIAVKLHYPTETVLAWLNQLHALKLVDKIKEGNSFVWQIHEEHRAIMVKYLELKVVDAQLSIEDEYDTDNVYTKEQQQKLNEDVMSLDMGYDDVAQVGFDNF